MRVRSEPCRSKHQLAWLGRNLREEDDREIRAATGDDPVAVLLGSFQMSAETHLLFLESSILPYAVFGIVPTTNGGIVWMVCTRLVGEAPKETLRIMARWAQYFGTRYGDLYALPMAENHLHVRWCAHMGFLELGRATIRGQEFIYIHRPSSAGGKTNVRTDHLGIRRAGSGDEGR